MSLKTFNSQTIATAIKTFNGLGKAFVKIIDGLAVNDYATRNPSDKHSSIALSGGSLVATGGGGGWRAVRATKGKSSGKRYWEIKNLTGVNRIIGVANSSANLANYVGSDANGWGYSQGALKYTNNSGSAYGATYAIGDTIGVALDMTAGTITMYKNNVSQGTMFTGLTGTLFPIISFQATESATANFGDSPLTYTPPVGFNAGLYS